MSAHVVVSLYSVHECVGKHIGVHLVAGLWLGVHASIIQQSALQQTMFKKRNTSKKAATIDDIVVDIDINPQQSIAKPSVNFNEQRSRNDEASKHDDGNMDSIDNAEEQNINAFIKQQSNKMSKLNSNSYDMGNEAATKMACRQDVHSNGNTHKYDYVMTDSEKLKEEERKEIEDCFAQFIKTQKQQQQMDRQVQVHRADDHVHAHSHSHRQNQQQQHQYNPFSHPNVQIEQHQPQQVQQPAPMTHQIIIQDESGEQIQVVEDYGELSSNSQSDSQNYDDGYENQIIKKTLTRYNYQQISKQLSHSHKQQRKHKLIKQLSKVSYSTVQRKIAKDLIHKKDRKNQLNNQITYIHNKIQTRHREIKDKITTKARLEADIDQTRRMLELLYYFGDQLDQFDEATLIKLTQEDDWKQKIDRIRMNIKKNKQRFDEQHLKKQQDDEQQKYKSEGDVEEIPKHRISEGWAGWDDGMDEQGVVDYHENGYEDDDQCIQIDDD